MSNTGPKPKGGTSYKHTPAELDEIVGHVLASGSAGMSRNDMLALMPMAAHRMKWLLALLALRRRIVPVGLVRWRRYFAPALAARAAAAKRHEDVCTYAEQSGESLPFRRVIVLASEATPLMPAGPRSVFELARRVA